MCDLHLDRFFNACPDRLLGNGTEPLIVVWSKRRKLKISQTGVCPKHYIYGICKDDTISTGTL